MVNKMVEQVKTKTEPHVRFRGFTDEWEDRKLEDVIISIQTGTNLLGAESNHGIPLIKMGNIQRGFFSFKKVEFLKDNEEVEERNMANFGDFLFNTRNTLELVGKGATWFGKDNKFAFNSNIARVTFEGINTIFFNYLYNTPQMIKQVRARAVGTTSVAAVYPKDLNSIKFWVPSESEQQKIGELFQTLDKTIDLSNTHVENLKQQKKALLQHLFPQKGETEPKVRLRGFTDEWEQVKLGDVLNYSQPTKYIVESDNYDDSFTTPVLTAGKSFLLGYTDETDGIYDKGDVILFDDFTTATQLVDFEFKVKSSAMKLLTPTGDNNINFLYETLNLVQYPHDDHKRYWISEYTTLKVKVPCDNDEQQAIGELFQTLDEQIRLAEDKVSQYKELKQALLQRLFV